MGCNNFSTRQDDELLARTWAGEHSVLSPELVEKLAPEVKRMIDERLDAMAEEQTGKFIDGLRGEQTPEERAILRELTRIAAEETEKAINQLAPTRVNPEERRAKREIGTELGLPISRWFGNPDITNSPDRALVKEVLTFLNDERIPRSFTRFDTVSQVQFVGRSMFTQDSRLIKGWFHNGTIYIFCKENGSFPHGRELDGIISHELVHANWEKIRSMVFREQTGYARALGSQVKEKGAPSQYSYAVRTEGQYDDREWMAELYRCYLVDHTQLSDEMIQFFDRHFIPEVWDK